MPLDDENRSGVFFCAIGGKKKPIPNKRKGFPESNILTLTLVTPVKTGVHLIENVVEKMDSGFRRNDGVGQFYSRGIYAA